MHSNYPKVIGESEEDLTRLEQRFRGKKPADRVRMLRLLKGGTVNSLKHCAPPVGYSVSHLTQLLGILSCKGPDKDVQAAQASRKGLETHCPGV